MTGKLVGQYAAYLEEQGLSRAAGARLIGCSAATLSQIVGGSYRGRTGTYTERMRSVLRRARLRKLRPRRPSITQTSVTERVQEALAIAHLERTLTLVMGPSGIGKTVGVELYCQMEPATLVLPAGPTATPWAIVRRLADELELEWEGSTYDMGDACAQSLAGSDRLVVVDEIDYPKERTLQTLRLIYDHAGIGMAWVGTPACLETLRRRRSATMRQITRRIAYVEPLGLCSDDDLAAIAAPYGLGKEALDVLVGGAAGEASRTVQALVAAQRMDGRGTSAATIRQAYASLMPAEE